MADAVKGSDAKLGKGQPAGSEPKKSAMKIPRVDGSASGKKSKKKQKKKKVIDDAATHDGVGKIASLAASSKDLSTSSLKKPKASKKSSSKEGRSDSKASVSKKVLHPKAGAEKLDGSEAKDAIKGKKAKKKKKKKKEPVASQLPSSPVDLLPRSYSEATQQPLLLGRSAPSSGILSHLEAFLGYGERAGTSQYAAAGAAPQVTSQLHPLPFLDTQGSQVPPPPSQLIAGQPVNAGEQPAPVISDQQTHLITFQPNLGQPILGQPTPDDKIADQQMTVDQTMRGQPTLAQYMPAQTIQSHMAPSYSLSSQPMSGQFTLVQPTPAELMQGNLASSQTLPSQLMSTQPMPQEPRPTQSMASQYTPEQTTSFADQPVPTQALPGQPMSLQPFPAKEISGPGQKVTSKQMTIPHEVQSQMTLDQETIYAEPQRILQREMAQTIPLSASQASMLTPSRRASVIFTRSTGTSGGPFGPTSYLQDSQEDESFYQSVALADPRAQQGKRLSLALPRRLASERTSVAQMWQSESPPSPPSTFSMLGQREMSRAASGRPSRSWPQHAVELPPRRASRSLSTRRSSRTRYYALADHETLSGAIYKSLPPPQEAHGVAEPVETCYTRRISQRGISESRSPAAIGEDAHWQPEEEDYEHTSQSRRSSSWREKSPRRAQSASRLYQPWETRCAADTTQHIKYTAAVAEDLRIASLALRRLQYDTETERRRRDFLATELMKRAALASSEVRRAALAAMYPGPRSAVPYPVPEDSAFPPKTMSLAERKRRLWSDVSRKAAEKPARPAAGPAGEQKRDKTSHRAHRAQGALLSEPARERRDSESTHFSFNATSSGAAAMPAARKVTSKSALVRKPSRASLAAVSESSSSEGSGCDLCGGLWRGLVREAPSEESSLPQIDEVLELGGRVSGPVTWPLSCPGSRKRSSVATVTVLSAVRRGSRRGSRRRPSEKPKHEAPDKTGDIEQTMPSPLEGFPAISGDLVASIAGKGDVHADEWNDTMGENTWSQKKGDVTPPDLDAGVPEPGQNGTTEAEGPPVREDDVETGMSKFAESSVHMFPESGVAAFFLVACLVWLAVMVFAGSAHHGSVTDEARTGRSRPDDEHSSLPWPPNERPTRYRTALVANQLCVERPRRVGGRRTAASRAGRGGAGVSGARGQAHGHSRPGSRGAAAQARGRRLAPAATLGRGARRGRIRGALGGRTHGRRRCLESAVRSIQDSGRSPVGAWTCARHAAAVQPERRPSYAGAYRKLISELHAFVGVGVARSRPGVPLGARVWWCETGAPLRRLPSGAVGGTVRVDPAPQTHHGAHANASAADRRQATCVQPSRGPRSAAGVPAGGARRPGSADSGAHVDRPAGGPLPAQPAAAPPAAGPRRAPGGAQCARHSAGALLSGATRGLQALERPLARAGRRHGQRHGPQEQRDAQGPHGRRCRRPLGRLGPGHAACVDTRRGPAAATRAVRLHLAAQQLAAHSANGTGGSALVHRLGRATQGHSGRVRFPRARVSGGESPERGRLPPQRLGCHAAGAQERLSACQGPALGPL
ncbi:bromodomain-containing protein 4-like isoform X4 [Dermacentor albipictus]|uniref:bromodomain-containing protein 4-like isoform X4 n=1 Tax=Dermacentor albipictus TaxID=60249 RepID=UPI0031FD6DDC